MHLSAHLVWRSPDNCRKWYKNQSIITTLKTLREDIHQDQVVLHEIVRQLGGKESVTRKVGAWAAEKLSRAKLDAEDDQLGLLQALEGLGLGIIGKRGLWRTLSTVSATITALQGLDCIGLENRAEDQFARVEAACLALAPSALSLT